MKHGIPTWIAGSRDIPHNLPGGRRELPVPPGSTDRGLPDFAPVPASMGSVVPRMLAVEELGGSSGAVRHIAAVAKPDAVPVSAEAVVAATSSVVARQEPVRPSVLETAVVADSAVQAAAVVLLAV